MKINFHNIIAQANGWGVNCGWAAIQFLDKLLYPKCVRPLMKSKIPTGVIVIAVVTILIGMSYLYFGGALLFIGSVVSGYGSTGTAVGGIFKAIGLVYLMLGGLSMLISIGLLTMKDWGRTYGRQFYIVLAVLCFILFLANPLLLLYGALYLFFYRYLNMTSTKLAFENYGYEKPDFHRRVRHTPAYDPQTPPAQQVSAAKIPIPEIKVPENMVLCPSCDMINHKTQQFCKRCASELDVED